MKHWLVIYDISDSKRLQKVAKIVEEYGVRVQYSVFEVYAGDKAIEELRRRIRGVIDEADDYVAYFDICERDWQKREKFGSGKVEVAQDKDFYIL